MFAQKPKVPAEKNAFEIKRATDAFGEIGEINHLFFKAILIKDNHRPCTHRPVPIDISGASNRFEE